MAVKDIVTIWDGKKLLNKNINFLRTPTKKVHLPASDSIKNIIQDLIDTYKSRPCAGIAANQIGYDKQIFIGMKKVHKDIDTEYIEELESRLSTEEGNSYPDNFEIYINPQIDKFDQKSMKKDEEGCLSIPGVCVQRTRFDKIKIRYYNEDGHVFKKKINGFLSKLFQHEIDHLNGKLMINIDANLDAIVPVDLTEKNLSKYKKLIKSYYANFNDEI